MTDKLIKKALNQKTQTVYALSVGTDGTFGVYKLCSNYDGAIRGGIRRTWRWIVRGVDQTTAQKTFKRRVEA